MDVISYPSWICVYQISDISIQEKAFENIVCKNEATERIIVWILI